MLPLSVTTAASGLFQKANLGLPYPSVDAKDVDETLLVLGASSSVGSSAVQLAVASGFTVIATASKKNHDYVRSLGASEVVDHSSPTVIDDLVGLLKGGKLWWF